MGSKSSPCSSQQGDGNRRAAALRARRRVAQDRRQRGRQRTAIRRFGQQTCGLPHHVAGGLQRLRPALDRFVLDRQLIKLEIRRQTGQKRGEFVGMGRCCVLHLLPESY